VFFLWLKPKLAGMKVFFWVYGATIRALAGSEGSCPAFHEFQEQE
jgi:hypothetical protein